MMIYLWFIGRIWFDKVFVHISTRALILTAATAVATIRLFAEAGHLYVASPKSTDVVPEEVVISALTPIGTLVNKGSTQRVIVVLDCVTKQHWKTYVLQSVFYTQYP